MANFCGKCGSRLDEATQLCPMCDAKTIALYYQKLKQKKKKHCFIKRVCWILWIVLLLIVIFSAAIHFDLPSEIRMLRQRFAEKVTSQECTLSTEPSTEESTVCVHQWQEATCLKPKVCSQCGEVEGDPLGHTLTEANYQAPAICSVCGTEIGEPMTPFFTEQGFACTITEMNHPYDYSNRSNSNPNKMVHGKLTVTDYEVFPSDEEHEALEGYEWKRVRFSYWFPSSELKNGWRIDFGAVDYYEGGDDGSSLLPMGETDTYSVNWNGESYDQCTKQFVGADKRYVYENEFLHTRCLLCVLEVTVREPIGYDGTVIVSYAITPEIESLLESGQSIAVEVLSTDNTLTFRMK